MTCPNLSNPTYAKIVEQYGKRAAYVASNLFDSAEFIAWKGDDEIPSLDDEMNVSSNTGDTFSLSDHLNDYLQAVRNTIKEKNPLDFALNNKKAEFYELTPTGSLVFRKEVSKEKPAINPTDKIIFGHPTIGKTFLKSSSEYKDAFISLDDDYAQQIKDFIAENKRPTEDKYQYQERKPQEFIDFTLKLFDEAKALAKLQGKMLFTSNNIVLDKRGKDFDKVVDLSKNEFFKRIGERNTTYDVKAWKEQIDKLIAKVDPSKVVKTSGYLSDLLPSKTKPQYQKPYKLGHVTEKYVRDIAERLKSKFGVDYKIINDGQKFWAGLYEEGVATINLAYASEDTPFHEFAHPFIDTLQVTNGKLFDKLTDELIAERAILLRTKQLYPELRGIDLVKEAMVQAIGEYAADDLASPTLIRWIKELLEELAKYLGNLFDGRIVLPAELPATLTLRHIGALLTSNLAIPVLTLEGIHQQKIQGMNAKMQGATAEQQKALQVLAINSKRMTLDEGPHTYQDEDGISHQAVSDVIGSTYLKKNKKEGEKDSVNIEWGKQADAILSAIVDNKAIPIDTPNLTSNTKSQIVAQFTKLVEELRKDGSVLVTQTIVSDSSAKVAGSTDLIRIRPNGSIDIYDLKTSWDSTLDEKYDQKHVHPVTGLVRSKRDQHTAQLTMYKLLAENLNLKVGDLAIIPLKVSFSKELATGAMLEDFVKITPSIVDSTKLLTTLRKANGSNDSVSQKKYAGMVDKLKILLQEKINRIENSQVSKTGEAAIRKAELNSLLMTLQGLDSVKEISHVIDTLYTELWTGKNKEDGYAVQFDTLASSIQHILIENNPQNIQRAIRKLNHYLDYISDFEGLDEFKTIYAESIKGKVTAEVDSPLYKLGKIIEIRDNIISGYQKAVAPLMARNIAELISPQAQQAAKEYLAKREKWVLLRDKAVLENKPNKVAHYQELIDKIQKDFERLATDEDKIFMQLTSSTGDMGMFEFLVGTMSNSSDNIMGLFAKKIKSVFTKVDKEMSELQREAARQFQAFAKATKRNQNDVEAFNKGLFEVVTDYRKNADGEYVAQEEKHFVNPLDTNRYNKAVLERNRQADKISLDKTNKKRREFIANWYQANHIPLEAKLRDELINAKKLELLNGYITDTDYRAWEQRNMYKDGKSKRIIYKNDLSQPHPTLYKSSAYEEIQRNPAMKTYYDFLLKLHKDAQAKLPISKELEYRLPSVGKELEDTIREKGGWKHIMPHIKDTFFKTVNDVDRYGNKKVVPTYFTHHMPAHLVSSDLMSSMLQFSQSSTTYQAVVGSRDVQGIEQEAIAFVNILKARDINKMDSNSQKVIKEAAKKLKMTDAEIEKQGGHYAAFAEHFINQIIYGVGEDKVTFKLPDNLGGATVDVGKTINGAMLAAAIPALGGPFTILKALANKLNGEYNVILEAFAREHFNWKAYNQGKKIYNKWVGKSMMQDMSAPVAVSKEGQLMDLFSPMQGHFRDHFGKEFTWSKGKRMMKPSMWFFFQGSGEHSIQNSMFFAMMSHTMVKQNGKDISLYDAYELDSNGDLTLKEGVAFSEKDREAFINKIHALNKPLHGVYNRMDKSVAQKNAIGRLLMMYRKFLVPAVKRRWGEIKVDQELGTTVEGFHRTLVRTIMNDWRELVAFYSGKETDLTALEEANIRRATAEIVSSLVLAGFIMILAGMRKDDKELKTDETLKGYTFNAALYELMRMKSEIDFHMPGLGAKDQLRVLTSPSAANGSLNKLAKFVEQLATGPFDTYDKKNAWYEKGESKTKTSLLSLLGYYGGPNRISEQFK